MVRVEYAVMKKAFFDILIGKQVTHDKAERIAEVMTDNTCDGVTSHGINRFVKMIEYMDAGHIDVLAEPESVSTFGGIAVLDGKRGFGITNALYSMQQAMDLASQSGIGCVALRNTNHWMRGATYGLQAAHQGYIGICFTNTLPNMPAWGSASSRIGNNPLIMAVPNGEAPIVLDMAMSQFSYGKMETLALEDAELPMDGGYDTQGQLTRDPKAILESQRILPTGYWKGSGLSMVLDLLATVLSGGNSTYDIGRKTVESAVSQVFIAIDPTKNTAESLIDDKIKATIDYVKSSERISADSEIYYPGERSQITRKENLDKGIPVNEKVWDAIVKMASA